MRQFEPHVTSGKRRRKTQVPNVDDQEEYAVRLDDEVHREEEAIKVSSSAFEMYKGK